MPVDPQIQTLLDRAAGVPATHTLPLAAARTQAESRVALMAPPAEIAGTAMRQVRDVLRLKTAGVAINEIARRVGSCRRRTG